MTPTTLEMPPIPACMIQAAAEYSLPLRAVLAIWLSEGGQPGTVSRNRNGSHDYGPFQVNTSWARRLREQFGVTEAMLTHDLCWSARAGAYILRYEINQAGVSFWDGVGHYHSHTPEHKHRYINTVYLNSLKF